MKDELFKQQKDNEKKIQQELAEHTKQVNDLQQKLSASELKTRTLESQNKSLQETQKQLQDKVSEMDKLRSDLVTAERESSQYKLQFLKQQEKKQKKEHKEEEDHYQEMEKTIKKE